MIYLKVLVTGGTGFIGGYLIPKLIDEGYNVRILTRNVETSKKKFGTLCEYFEGNITDPNTLTNCCMDIDVVIHMAAISGNDKNNKKNKDRFLKINYYGTKNLIEEAKTKQVKKFIYISSSAALGVVNEKIIDEATKSKAKIPYDYSKYLTEQFLLNECNSFFDIVVLRPTKVYGENENSTSILKQLRMAKKGYCINIGFKSKYFSNLYIEDFINAIVLSIKNGQNIYLISSNSITTKDFANICGNHFDRKVKIIYLPKFIAYGLVCAISLFSLLTHRKKSISFRNIKSMSTNRIYNCSRAKQELGYEYRIDMKSGMLRMIDWYEQEGKL